MNALAPHLAVLQVVVPLAAAPLALLLRGRGLAWAAAVASSACALAIAWALRGQVLEVGAVRYAVGGWSAPYGIELVVDAFSALLLLVVTGASTVALVAARPSSRTQVAAEHEHLFYAAWLLALGGLNGMLVAGDAFNVFVFMEISSLATYVLVAGGPDRRALPAVFKYLIMGTIGATFYLVGVGLLYMATGTLNLLDIAARLPAGDERPVAIAVSFITIGLALKAAVFPLHTWLPNAYTYAPHAVTVFIAACSTKVALYLLLRFDFVVFQAALPQHVGLFGLVGLALAMAAIVIASGIALFEHDVKKILAYSSVAQIGYMLFGAALASTTGLTGAIAHMFGHALAKGALFVAIASFAVRGAEHTLAGLAGMGRRMPFTSAAFVVAGLSLIGIPGTAGFVGKWYLVLAAAEHGVAGILLAVPVLAGSLLAVVYVWRVVERLYFGVATASSAKIVREPFGLAAALLWMAVLANLYFGLQTDLQVELARAAAATLLGDVNGS
jgi:multicomponent Na+:H+ antiporter subunit D